MQDCIQINYSSAVFFAAFFLPAGFCTLVTSIACLTFLSIYSFSGLNLNSGGSKNLSSAFTAVLLSFLASSVPNSFS